MATNADFDALIVRITTATNTLETDVATINEGASDIEASVTAAQLAATQAGASATTATTQANNAANSATQAQALVTALEAAVIIEEAPVDGQQYARQDASWTVVSGGGGSGTVQSVNNVEPDVDGNITLTAADVGAKPSSYVPTWAEVTGKPTTFAPIIGTTATTALAGNTVIPTNTNQLTNGANFVTALTAPVRSVAGKAGVVVLEAADIASGVMAPARLGTGTPSGTTVLLGDGTWGSAPSANAPLDVTFTYNGTSRTTWPFGDRLEPCDLSLVTAGSNTGSANFSSTAAVNALPVGKYYFGASTFASGALNGQLGVITVDKVNATQRRAWAFVQAVAGDTAGKMYVHRGSDGAWLPV